MDATTAWRVEPLSPSLRDDFLGFMDHERGRAFVDNPAWSRCYCHFFHVAPALDWEALDAQANRTAIAARIDVGEMEGFLARDGAGSVVGWLNAQPRHKLAHCFARLEVPAPSIDVPSHAAAVVLCFVIDPALRRQGVARALLDAALGAFSARGIRIVDAFPRTDANGAAAHFRGPRGLFEQFGFECVATHGTTLSLRRRLP